MLCRNQRWATEVASLVARSETVATIGGVGSGFDIRCFLLDVDGVGRAGVFFFGCVLRGRF